MNFGTHSHAMARGELLWAIVFRLTVTLILLTMVAPVVVMIILSFNSEPYFTFTADMLALKPSGYSLRWYQQLWQEPLWVKGFKNSALIGLAATLIATPLGTLADQLRMRPKGAVISVDSPGLSPRTVRKNSAD